MIAGKPELSRNARHFINAFQGDFPISETPYRQAAARLGMTEAELIALIGRLIEDGWLSRFGPIFDASRLGGAQTLAALAVPEHRFEEVSSLVNGFNEVAHNYRRGHALNMWCVIATERSAQIEETIKEIERATELQVLNFPKLREFYIGLRLWVGAQGDVDTVRFDPPQPIPETASHLEGGESVDREIVLALQSGLPLEPMPYAKVAAKLDMDPPQLMNRIRTMLAQGAIRRIGAIPNHYRLGLRANGMTVWNVDDEFAEEAGREIGSLACVSHCYLRPRYKGVWPYNLFAMVHGQTRQQVGAKAQSIATLLGGRCRDNDILYSTAMLKKTGLRLAA